MVNKFKAQKLIVTATEIGYQDFNFNAYEFENGAIMVEHDLDHNEFFNSRDSIEPCGLAQVKKIEETKEYCLISRDDILESLNYWEDNFGENENNLAIKEILNALPQV